MRSLDLFGSLARDEGHPGSDEDLLVGVDGAGNFDPLWNERIHQEKVDLSGRIAYAPSRPSPVRISNIELGIPASDQTASVLEIDQGEYVPADDQLRGRLHIQGSPAELLAHLRRAPLNDYAESIDLKSLRLPSWLGRMDLLTTPTFLALEVDWDYRPLKESEPELLRRGLMRGFAVATAPGDLNIRARMEVRNLSVNVPASRHPADPPILLHINSRCALHVTWPELVLDIEGADFDCAASEEPVSVHTRTHVGDATADNRGSLASAPPPGIVIFRGRLENQSPRISLRTVLEATDDAVPIDRETVHDGRLAVWPGWRVTARHTR